MALLRRYVLACVLAACFVAVCNADAFRLTATKGKSSAVTSSVFDRLCYSHPASVPSCSVGPFVPLAKRAPEPQTVGGKLAAKAAAYMYTCYQRNQTACGKDSICYWVDAEGYCTLASTYLQTIRTTMVCPGSKAEIAAYCGARNDESACIEGADSRCKWIPCSAGSCVRVSNTNSNATGQCLGNVPALLANDVSIVPGLESGDNSVWGCCDSQKLYASMKQCKDIGTSTPCTGNCQWNDMRNECEASLSGQYSVWGMKEANFSTFIAAVDTACNALTTDEKCVAQYKVDIDQGKVKKYLAMELKEMENACSEVLLSEASPSDPMASSNSTASTPVRFSAAGMLHPVALLGLLPVLGLAAAL